MKQRHHRFWIKPLWTVAAVASYVWAMLPINGRGDWSYTLSRYMFAALVLGGVVSFFWKSRREAEGNLARCYHFPDRFGIGSLLAMVLLFAVVSAVLRWSNAYPVVSGFVLSLLGLAAMLQALLPKPRSASMAAGALLLPSFVLVAVFLYAPHRLGSLYLSEFAFRGALLAVAGAVAGYIAGAIVASVFLVLDLFATRKGRRAEH
jgi:hypothetical protein